MKVNKLIEKNSLTKETISHLKVVENNSRALSVMARKRRNSDNPLRNVRVNQGFTLDDLSEKSGLSPSYLSRLEGGSRRLNLDILDLLCKTLNCDPKVLEPMTQISDKECFTQKIPSTRKKTSLEKVPSYALSPLGNKQGYYLNTTTKKMVKRPYGLPQSEKAFALNVEASSDLLSMSQDKIIYVNPTASFGIGSTVFAQLAHQQRCYVGKLTESSTSEAKQIFTLELPSKEEVTVEREQLASMFKIESPLTIVKN